MNTLIILFFILFSYLIYLINNFYIIIILLVINLMFLFLTKSNIKSIKYFIFLISITVIINYFFLSFQEAILIGLRLINIYLLTLIMSNYLSINKISKGISGLFFFSKKKKYIEFVISLSLSLIPIFIDECQNIRKVLICKNFKFNLKNIFTSPSIFINTFLNNLFNRIQELEKVLICRNFE